MRTSPTDLTAAPFNLDSSASDWVEQNLSTLSTAEKVGQLLCVYLLSDDMTEWKSWMTTRGISPSAVMMTSRPREAARRDLTALQDWSRIPLLTAGNLESGAVNFLDKTEAFANPMQVAATGNTLSAERLAVHCARLANEVGINWAFAPVVDVAISPHNPITNTRAFSNNADIVAKLGETYVQVLEERSIATSAKHFPGDGVDDRDQHLVTTSNNLDTDTWWSTFGTVYQRIIAAGARTMMVGHIRQPALTRAAIPNIAPADIMPASLSPELITGVLRNRLGYNGLVITDNSAMTGFTSVMPREQALPRAINAGNDMLLGNLDVEEDYNILLDAVRSGEISTDRLNEAVRRILALKASIGLHLGTDRSTWEQPDHKEETAWRDELARESITIVKDTQSLLPIDPTQHRRVLVYVLGDSPTFYDPSGPFADQFVEGLEARGLKVEVRQIPGNTTTPLSASRLHLDFDLCIYFANVRFIGNSNVLRVTWTPWQAPDAPRHVAKLPTLLVSIADPYLLQDMPMIKTAINGYTPTPSTVEASLAVLFGEHEANGVSPIDPFGGYWDAAL